MARQRHPIKEIEAVVRYAISLGWRFVKGSGHAWGILYCPRGERDGCHYSVYCTPKNPFRHAQQLRNRINRCPHRQDEEHD
jgi:hypothetical protein